MNLKPAEVAMRQFSRTLLGANPAEVRAFLLAAAASLERVNDELAGVLLERASLQTALRHANAEVESLRAQLAEARSQLAAYRGQEAVLARAVIEARHVTEELSRGSKEEAERTVAHANAVAKETLETARQSAAELLRAARAHAQQAVEAADRTAAVRLAEVQLEAERLTAGVRSAAAEVRQAAQAQIEEFIARLEAFLANREELAQSLDALAKHHAGSLDLVARLHAEVERIILPALRELTQTVSEREPGPRGHAALSAPSVGERRRSQERDDDGRDGVGRAGPVREPVRGGPPAPPAKAELVVSPIHSYLQATKLVTAVSRMTGVKTARLRSYAKGTITIDVATEAGTVAALDPRLINGGPVDVVEATDRRMVVRLREMESGRAAGSESRV